MTQPLRWDAPFEALTVGDAFETRGRTVTEADVAAFAALTWDTHPQHTDEAWAAARGFGGRIAHGMLVIAFAAGLVPFDPDRVLALRKVGDATFKRPVRFGDTLTVAGKIAELTAVSDEAGLVTFAWTVRNQEGQGVCRASVAVLWRRQDGVETAQ